MLRRRSKPRPSRNSIPLSLVTWHKSTLIKGVSFELWDNEMKGFDGRFRVRCYVAGHLISDEVFNSEVDARDEFESKVEEHYD